MAGRGVSRVLGAGSRRRAGEYHVVAHRLFRHGLGPHRGGNPGRAEAITHLRDDRGRGAVERIPVGDDRPSRRPSWALLSGRLESSSRWRAAFTIRRRKSRASGTTRSWKSPGPSLPPSFRMLIGGRSRIERCWLQSNPGRAAIPPEWAQPARDAPQTAETVGPPSEHAAGTTRLDSPRESDRGGFPPSVLQ